MPLAGHALCDCRDSGLLDRLNDAYKDALVVMDRSSRRSRSRNPEAIWSRSSRIRMPDEPEREREPQDQDVSAATAAHRWWRGYVSAGQSRRGPQVLRDWVDAVGGNLDGVCMYNLFDKHGVADEMSWHQAAEVGVELSHMEHACNVLCSFGRHRRQSTFHRHEWLPFVAELDGYVFVDAKIPRGYPVQDNDWLHWY